MAMVGGARRVLFVGPPPVADDVTLGQPCRIDLADRHHLVVLVEPPDDPEEHGPVAKRPPVRKSSVRHKLSPSRR